MAKITGQLQAIITKSFGNGGDAVFIKVNNTEYKFGKYAPRGFAEGDWVEFDASSRVNGQYTNWTADYKTLRKADPSARGNPSPEPVPEQQARPARGSGYTSTGNDDRQEIISKQAALNTGFNLFSKLVDLGAIVPPAAVKKNGLYDFYMAAFHNEAAKCFKLSTGKDWDIAKATEKPEDDFSEEVGDIDNGGESW